MRLPEAGRDLVNAVPAREISLFKPLIGDRLVGLQSNVVDKDLDEQGGGVGWSWHARYCRGRKKYPT